MMTLPGQPVSIVAVGTDVAKYSITLREIDYYWRLV